MQITMALGLNDAARHIVSKGDTLGFDVSGLLSCKTATVIIATGGAYTEGAAIADGNIVPQCETHPERAWDYPVTGACSFCCVVRANPRGSTGSIGTAAKRG